MKAAIATLQVALDTLVTNEPINRAWGNIEQADAEAANAAEIREALGNLATLDGPCVRQWLAGQDTFIGKLRHAINCHSKENGSDTPDFILADYLNGCLDTYDKALQEREKWYGRETPRTKAGVDPTTAP